MLLPLLASADPVEIGGIYYNLSGGNASVAPNPNGKYSGSIIIPESVTYGDATYSVTSIGDRAFEDCSGLTSITIPNGVTSIGGQAFFGAGLTSVTIPNSVKSIGTQAFAHCGLKSVTIPSSVTDIRIYAFQYCSGLESIVVESGNPVYDSRENCNAIIETAKNSLVVGCKTTVIPNSVTFIGHGAFFGRRDLTTITIPNSVTSIGSEAFADCSGLTSITIPSSVTSIGYCSFGTQQGLSINMTSVTSLATTPPQANEIAFTKFDIPLYVPKGTRDAYLAASPWNKFKEIIEIDNTDEDEKKAYAVLNDNNTVLTFYYDNQKAARNGMDVGPFYGYNKNDLPSWYGQRESITSVVFDASFANCTTLTSTAYWFCSLQNLSSITGISNLKTDNVTDMQDMFAGCSHLTSLDLKEFKTDNVTDMSRMFDGCSGLTSLDLTGFKTDNVTNMHGMFYGCSGLTSLDLTGVRTDNVTDMGGMFGSCFNLTSLDVSGFKTDNVMDMSCVFQACFGLTSLDVSGFKTDNVTNMLDMFSFCSGLTSLDVTGFKTDNVTNMGGMFRDCSGLTNLDVTGFKTDIVTDMHEMFDRCSGLTSLDVTGFKTDNVTDMGGMFSGCSGLTNLDVTGFKTDKVTSMWNMFARCSGLTNLDVTGFKTDKVTNMESMFWGCSNLMSLDVTGFKTDNVTNMRAMFSGCSGLTSLDVTGFKTDNVTDMRSMFFGCSGLKSLDVTGFKTDNVMDMGWLFSGCSSLKTIYAGDGWSTAKVQIGESMFTDCTSLVGGAGTIFNAIHTDHTYAHIDGGSSNPGYFTSKGATPVEEDVDEITIKDIGKTTWCSEYDLDFTNVEGIKAYTATGYDDIDKTIWLTRVMKVPAGTGILVKGDAGTYKIPHVNVRAYYTNMLVGNVGEAIKIEETDGDKTNYYLSGKDGTFVSVNGNANIGKNKAYLQLPTSVFSGTRSIGISYDDEDGTTGINVQSSKFNVQSDAYYTLQGQRVVNPGKGLYIKNGKKVVIK